MLEAKKDWRDHLQSKHEYPFQSCFNREDVVDQLQHKIGVLRKYNQGAWLVGNLANVFSVVINIVQLVFAFKIGVHLLTALSWVKFAVNILIFFDHHGLVINIHIYVFTITMLAFEFLIFIAGGFAYSREIEIYLILSLVYYTLNIFFAGSLQSGYRHVATVSRLRRIDVTSVVQNYDCNLNNYIRQENEKLFKDLGELGILYQGYWYTLVVFLIAVPIVIEVYYKEKLNT